jgi:glycerophosphoryl diester phosphodiesterase
VNESSAARRLFDRGVRGVFTDFPGRMRAELEAAA